MLGTLHNLKPRNLSTDNRDNNMRAHSTKTACHNGRPFNTTAFIFIYTLVRQREPRIAYKEERCLRIAAASLFLIQEVEMKSENRKTFPLPQMTK